ncbi:hypothetical protein HELRODRAFT_144657, partial [Helobdella robusta]|uniref:HMG box domain-containing protein n=1 Tax=Helobdella robusta TaxID=6412 RepID=T1EJF5_HELRO
KSKSMTSAYAFFMKATREELKKSSSSMSNSEFSKHVSEKWKSLSVENMKTYEEMASRDSIRYQEEMANYALSDGEKAKNHNAPKTAWFPYVYFAMEERPKIKAEFPKMRFTEIAKELGKRWKICPNKEIFEAMAAKDKEKHEMETVASDESAAVNQAVSKDP